MLNFDEIWKTALTPWKNFMEQRWQEKSSTLQLFLQLKNTSPVVQAGVVTGGGSSAGSSGGGQGGSSNTTSYR